MTEIQEFIRRLPKAELHLHLEGTIAPATLVELSARHDVVPLTHHDAEALYRFSDFTEFIESFKAVTRRLRDPEDYEIVAWHMMEQLAAQGVVHAEVYISVGVIYMWRNFDPRCFEPIFAALERARERAARELGLSLFWIFDAVRHFTVEEADRVFRKAAEMREHYPSVVAIGLGGDERRCASEPFRHLYARAQSAGLRLTNHAGETTGPEAIWEALAIGSERIGHALSAIQRRKTSPRPEGAERAALSSIPTPMSAPASVPPSPLIPSAATLIAASWSHSTPTIQPSLPPTSPTSSSSPTPSRGLPATSSASWPPIPSVPASFLNRKKPHGWPKLTLSRKVLPCFPHRSPPRSRPTCAIM